MERLTRDSKTRYTTEENQTAIAKYTLAVERRYNRSEEVTADFIPCVAFGKAGEFAESKNSGSNTNSSAASAGSTDDFMSIPDGIVEEFSMPFYNKRIMVPIEYRRMERFCQLA